jgi:hypothetical protein
MEKERGICKWCEKSFDKGHYSTKGKWVNNSAKKYCDPKCRNEAKRKQHDRGERPKEIGICSFCGKEFEKGRYNDLGTWIPVKHKKYCDKKCYDKSLLEKHQQNAKTEIGICPICNKKFNKGFRNKRGNWQRLPSQKVCSKECKKKYENLQKTPKATLTFICEHCKKPFEKTGSENTLKRIFKYCTKECSVEARKERIKSSERQKGAVKRGHLQISQSRGGSLLPKYIMEFPKGDTVPIPNYRFGFRHHCTYCGATPQDVDHCIAWAYISAPGDKRSNVRGITTYSCHKCNSKLSDRMFDSFIERVIFIRSYYVRVLKRFFTHWTLKEIKQENFDYGLETFILDHYHTRDLCEERVKWTETKEFIEIMDQNKFSIIQNIEKFTPKQTAYLIEYFNLT